MTFWNKIKSFVGKIFQKKPDDLMGKENTSAAQTLITENTEQKINRLAEEISNKIEAANVLKSLIHDMVVCRENIANYQKELGTNTTELNNLKNNKKQLQGFKKQLEIEKSTLSQLDSSKIKKNEDSQIRSISNRVTTISDKVKEFFSPTQQKKIITLDEANSIAHPSTLSTVSEKPSHEMKKQ
jgi:uncharacterized protein (DUF3084 family)